MENFCADIDQQSLCSKLQLFTNHPAHDRFHAFPLILNMLPERIVDIGLVVSATLSIYLFAKPV